MPLNGAGQTTRMICAVLIICVFVVHNATKAGFLLPLKSAFLERINQNFLPLALMEQRDLSLYGFIWIYPLLDRA